MIVTGRSRLQRGETLARLPLPGGGKDLADPARGRRSSSRSDCSSAWTRGPTRSSRPSRSRSSSARSSSSPGTPASCRCASSRSPVSARGWRRGSCRRTGGRSRSRCSSRSQARRSSGSSSPSLPFGPAARAWRSLTLALALMFSALIFTNSAVTGGVRGLPIDQVSVFGIDLDPLGHPQRYGAFVLLMLVLVGFLVANLRRGTSRRASPRRPRQRARGGVTRRRCHRGEGVCVLGRGRDRRARRRAALDAPGQRAVHAVQRVRLGAADPVRGGRRDRVGVGSARRRRRAQRARQCDLRKDRARQAPTSCRGSRCCRAWARSRCCVRRPTVWRRSGRGHSSRFTAPLAVPARRSRARRPHRGARHVPATLDVTDLFVNFGGVVAVDGVSFAVEPGEVVGLIGPNGAGKTTILDVITGFTTQSSGSVQFDGDRDRQMVGRAPRPSGHRAVVAGGRAVRGDDRAREPPRRRRRPVAAAAT